MDRTLEIAEAFPPGDFIREELEARGWLQADLAEILGIQPSVVSALVQGKKAVTPEIAKALAAAFGTSAQLWMNLESTYRLFVTDINDDRIARLARLYANAPVKSLVKRGWVEASDSIEVFEERICEFFETTSIDALTDDFAHAARKSTDYSVTTREQAAWLCQARRLALSMSVSNGFTPARLSNAVTRLQRLLGSEQEVRHVPRVLSEAGIRLLIVEHLPTTRIDGATFWLNAKSPVVVLSMRFDRLDWFWQSLMHELCHVQRKDGLDEAAVDSDMMEDDAKPKSEKEIDSRAADLLINREDLADFVARVAPLFSKKRIWGFAARLKIHPAIVVGQLQHGDHIPYSHSREMLVKVRHIVIQSALTDGWGHMPVVAL
jgi:HTH-type transcriptional regulator/antitoxin HigA